MIECSIYCLPLQKIRNVWNILFRNLCSAPFVAVSTLWLTTSRASGVRIADSRTMRTPVRLQLLLSSTTTTRCWWCDERRNPPRERSTCLVALSILDVQDICYLFSSPNVYEYSGMGVHTLDMDFLVRVHGDPDTLKATVHAADDAAEALWIPISEINPDEFGLTSIRNAVIRFCEKKK